MSRTHPIITVTGSSGAGTSYVQRTLATAFDQRGWQALFIAGDGFHRYTREQMINKRLGAQQQDSYFSHFGEEANLLDELEASFCEYAEHGACRHRIYIHDAETAQRYRLPPGTFTPWQYVTTPTDMLFYEGLHGAVSTDTVNIAALADLKIGVVPTVNLEWIQKIHRDHHERGYHREAVIEAIIRRMPDYVRYITPQFSRTDINFQRVPIVDTANPFADQLIPLASESQVVIHRRNQALPFDFIQLQREIPSAFLSRSDTLVIPGEYMEIAICCLIVPIIAELVDIGRQRRTLVNDNGVI